MHAIFFGLKRAHHGTLRLTRASLAKAGLTAARFDLLYAVKRERRGMAQSALRRCLGVSRATVSRMLASLEQRGMVRRKRCRFDRRSKIVRLTRQGRRRIARTHRDLTRSGWAQLAIDSALGAEGRNYRWYDDGDCMMATSKLEGLLNPLRHEFRDHATLAYPWSPDDIDPSDPFLDAWLPP